MIRSFSRWYLIGLLVLGGFSTFAQPTFSITNVKNSCAGLNNGSFDINILSGNGAINVLIFGPPNFARVSAVGATESFTGLKPQNYIIIVQDADGNTIQFQSITNVAANISLSSGPTVVNNSDCVTPNGSISIAAAGGTGTYNYAWTGPGGFSAATQNISGLAAGAYQVTVSDPTANCSFTSALVTVTDPVPNSFTISSPSTNLCLGDVLTINLSAAQNGVTFTVYVDGFSTGTFVTGPTAVLSYPGLAAGVHAVNVKAEIGICTPVFSTNSLSVTVNSPPTSAVLSLNGLNPICIGASTTLKVNIAGGTGPFNLTIPGIPALVAYVSGTPIAITPAATTTYDLTGVTVTDSKGCTVVGSGSVTVNVNPLPTATIGASPAAICLGQGSATLTFTLTGTGPFTVKYSDGFVTNTLSNIANGHTVSVSPPATRTYTITSVTDATTCPGAAGSSAVVTVNNPPTSATLSLTGAASICTGLSSSIKVTIVGGASPYNFTIPGLAPIVGYVSGTAINVTPAVTTTYGLAGVTVTDAKGCTVSGAGSTTVTVNPLPTAAISASPAAICAGQGSSTLTFALTGAGPYNVQYSDGTTTFTLSGISNGHTVSVSPAATKTYTITSITDATTCAGVAGSNAKVTVSTPASAAALSLTGAATICSGQSTTIKVTVTGGTGPFNFTIPGIAPLVGYVSGSAITVTPAVNTIYSLAGVTVTDALGCTVSGAGSTSITVNPLPTATLASAPGVICAGQGSSTLTFTMTGTAPFNVNYSDGTTTFNLVGIANGHTVSVSPAVTKTYTISAITDATTCLGVPGSNATVTVNTPATGAALGLTGSGTICVGQSTTLAVVITGGTGPFNFTIPGIAPFVGYVSGTPITVSPAVNTTYSLAGVTVTDVKGCTVVGAGSVTITANPIPTAVIAAAPGAICAGQGNSTLSFTLTGTGPFNVNYSDGTTTFNLVGISTGHTVSVSPGSTKTYTVTSVTDATTCGGVAGSNTTVTVNTPPVSATLSLLGSNPICLGQSTTLRVTVVGGQSPYHFTIPGIAPIVGYVSGTAIAVSPVVNTTYNLTGITVTDAKGCTVSGSGSVAVVANTAPTATVGALPSTICSGSSSTLTFTLTGTGPFNVNYSDGTTTFNLVGISTGHAVVVSPVSTKTYTITSVADATACPGVAGSNASVTVNSPPTSAVLSLNGSNPICNGQSSSLKVTIAGGSSPYNFTIPGLPPLVGYVSGTAIPVSPVANTTYSLVGVTVTDAKGCNVSGSGAIPIVVTTAPTATVSGGGSVCVGAPLPNVTFTFTGTAPFHFTYSNGATSTNVAGHPSNTYTIAAAPSGTYSVTALSDNVCTASSLGASVSVSTKPLPTASVSGGGATCAGGALPNIVFTFTGTAPFSFTYSDGVTSTPVVGHGSNTYTINNAPAGTYSVTGLTDNSGCSATSLGVPMPVTVFALPTASISGGGTVCSSAPIPAVTFTFTGTSPYDFSYSDGTTTIAVAGYASNTFTIASPAVGNYSVVSLKDKNGCNATSLGTPVALAITPVATATLSGTASICVSGSTNLSIALTGTSPWNVVYNDGVSNITVNGVNASPLVIPVTPAATTTYSMISATDAVCGAGTVSGSAVVTVINAAIINVPPAPAQVCQTGGIVNLSTIVSAVPAGGSFTFSGTGVTASPSFDPTLVVGSSNITVNYTSGTCTATTNFNLGVTAAASITVPGAATVVCQNAGIVDMRSLATATPLGGSFTFVGAGVAGNNFDPSGQSGIVNVTVNYAAGGCTDSKVLSFNVTPIALLTITPATVCPGPVMVDLRTLVSAVPAGGAFTFTGPNVAGNNFDPASHQGSVVTLNVSYFQNGCTVTGNISVTVRAIGDPLCGSVVGCGLFTTAAVDTRPSCANQNDGAITFTASGGAPNYVVTLFDGVGFSQALAGAGPIFNFTNLSPSATYKITINDASGNSCTLNHSLLALTTVQATAGNFIDAICYNQPTGGATITVNSGGSAPYEYSADGGTTWISFTSPAPVNNLMPNAAPYAILVRDDATDNCPAQVLVTINNPIDISTVVTPQLATCLGNDGSVLIGPISGGTQPYTYALDGNTFAVIPPGNQINALSVGAHIFSVFDAKNCQKDFPFNITFPGLVNMSTSTTSPDCSGNGTNGTVDVTVLSIGTFQVGISSDPLIAPAMFINVVSAGAALAHFTGVGAGTYYITAQPGAGLCQTVMPVTISGGPYAVDFQMSPVDGVCFDTKGGVVISQITGAPGLNYTYQVVNVAGIVQSGSITSVQAAGSVNLTGLDAGLYQVQLFQDQSSVAGCVAPISSSTKDLSVNGPTSELDTLYVRKTISLPDRPTGIILVGIQETGLGPYQVRLDPIAPTQGSLVDWTDAVRDPLSLHMELQVRNLAAGSYQLSIRDGFGCEKDYTILLDVDTSLFIPNIFSPNGDNLNDVFFIRNGEGANVVISNRWGKEVFKSSNYHNDWSASGVDDGVYFYRIIAVGKTFSGWVEIQRGQ